VGRGEYGLRRNVRRDLVIRLEFALERTCRLLGTTGRGDNDPAVVGQAVIEPACNTRRLLDAPRCQLSLHIRFARLGVGMPP
jgi:hypothetical protein